MYRQLPNLLTLLRLFLAAVFFVVLNQYRYASPQGPHGSIMLWIAFVVFILAAISDMLDGFLARRWKVESRFGRIMDPFCDKVLVIGAFMYLAGPRFVIPDRPPDPLLSLNMITGVYPWMVVVILARELFVTSIRGELEGRGSQFGAKLFGKLKMILQSITIPTVLALVYIDPLKHPAAGYVRDSFVYATVLATILSGLPYLAGAKLAMKEVEPVAPKGQKPPGPQR